MSVTVKMTGDERDLVKAQERVEKGAAGITAEYKKLSQESLQTQRFAKRAWEESLPPLQRYESAMEKLNRTYQGTARESDEYKAAVAKLEAQHLGLGITGTKGLKSIGMELVALLGPVASIGGAVALVSNATDKWVENTREISQVTRETMQDLVAFAAMQEPGVGRERARRVLEASRGAATFGQAFDIAQGMQSAMGSFEQGLMATREILAATRVGIPAELAREVATQAIAQQQDPGKWLRGIYAAGEVSLRDPKMIAPAAPALQAFRDKTFGIAAAAQLAGTFGPELMAYTRQAGYALSGVSPAKEWFARQGLTPEATESQRLAMLAERSMDTIEELETIGLTEIRQAGAIQNLVVAYADVAKYRRTIEAAMTTGGLLETKRAGIEQEFPEAALARRISEEESRFREGRAFNREAMEWQLRQKVWAAELANRGMNQGAFGLDLFDAEGQLNWKAFQFSRMWGGLAGNQQWQGAENAVSRRVQRALDSIDENTVRPAPRPRVAAPEQ